MSTWSKPIKLQLSSNVSIPTSSCSVTPESSSIAPKSSSVTPKSSSVASKASSVSAIAAAPTVPIPIRYAGELEFVGGEIAIGVDDGDAVSLGDAHDTQTPELLCKRHRAQVTWSNQRLSCAAGFLLYLQSFIPPPNSLHLLRRVILIQTDRHIRSHSAAHCFLAAPESPVVLNPDLRVEILNWPFTLRFYWLPMSLRQSLGD